jgi:methanogenic corrinoid protein MtbC1
MRKTLTDFTDDPVYNMKAVEQQTGISAATLRAWERRYALVEPKRTPSGYRLYSDRDVALLRWVRDRMTEGLTVSRVVAMLEGLRQGGETLWIENDEVASNGRMPAPHEAPIPPNTLVIPLYDALVDLDDERADEVMEQAFAMYTMPTVYVDVIAPALVEVGEAWHRGDIFISTEHFATTYLRGRLLGLLQAYPQRADMPSLFVGCAPHERHEVGALIFAVMLRQAGYNVVYLGQDIPIEDVIEAALHEHPAMLCLSASNPTTALSLRSVQLLLDKAAPPVPLFGYGGRAFDLDPELRTQVKGYYLGADPRDALNFVNNLLRERR